MRIGPVFFLLCTLAACGQAGDLYLPDHPPPDVQKREQEQKAQAQKQQDQKQKENNQ